MFSCATLMNCRSVAEQVCETAARPFPPRRRTSAPVANSAKASPAAAEKRGFTHLSSDGFTASLITLSGLTPRLESCLSADFWLKDQAAVRAVALHADSLVDADRGGVLGPDEQADGGDVAEEQSAEVTHPTLGKPLVPLRRVDPDLLHLHGRWRPRRGFRLE